MSGALLALALASSPPAPPALADTHWRYTYGGIAGVLTLGGSGSFVAVMDSGAVWAGTWDADAAGVLRLTEWVYPAAGGPPSGPGRYAFAPDPGSPGVYAAFPGADPGAGAGTRVTLTPLGAPGGPER